MPCGPASDEMDSVDPFDIFGLERDLPKRDISLLERDAAAKGIGDSPRLLVDLFDHEVAVAVLAGRHRVPGDLFNRPPDGFSTSIHDAKLSGLDLRDFSILKKADSSRMVQ